MSDDIWPNLETGPNEHETREQGESVYNDALQTELNEQERIGDAQTNPFDHNRVPTPGDGAGGRVRVNRDHWGE